MSAKEKWKWAYKVVRSILFTSIAVVTFLYVLLYVLLSIPSVQNNVKGIAERELSKLFTSHLKIGNLSIYPFNEVVVEDAVLYEPSGGAECVRIKRLGAGISLWRLITDQKIVISYVELLGLDARLHQSADRGPLNIQFLIDAFKPKDKNKPPTPFDLEIRNIVIRQCCASLTRSWIPAGADKFPDYRIVNLDSLNADVVLPTLKNDDIQIDLRRLTFVLEGITKVKNLSGKVKVDSTMLHLSGIDIQLPNTLLQPSDISIPLNPPGGFGEYLASHSIPVALDVPVLRPSDLAFLWMPLRGLDADMSMRLRAVIGANLFVVSDLQINTVGHVQGRSPGRADNNFRLSLKDASVELSPSGIDNSSDAATKMQISRIGFNNFDVSSTPEFNACVLNMLRMMHPHNPSSAVSDNVMRIVSSLNQIHLTSQAHLDLDSRLADLNLDFTSGIGTLLVEGKWGGVSHGEKVDLLLTSDELNIKKLFDAQPVEKVSVNLKADVTTSTTFSEIRKAGKISPDRLLDLIVQADVEVNLPEIYIDGYGVRDTELSLRKDRRDARLDISCGDENFNLALGGEAHLAGGASTLDLDGDIHRLRPGVINPLRHKFDFEFSGALNASLRGNNPDNLTGQLSLQNINFHDCITDRHLTLDSFDLMASTDTDGYRKYDLVSDWIEGSIRGKFIPTRVTGIVKGILAETLPEFIKSPRRYDPNSTRDEDLTFDFIIPKGGNWSEFFNLPVTLLYDASISGMLDGTQEKLGVRLSAPYIRQGRDKLIRNLSFSGLVNHGNADIDLNVIYPTKKGDLELVADIKSLAGDLFAGFDFNPGRTTGFYGHLDLEADISNSIAPLGKMYSLHIMPSTLYLNNAAWNVADSRLKYFITSTGNIAEIDGFGISHDGQFVAVNGRASADPEDAIIAQLNEIDLNYIFDTLNINYVHFGGLATGEAVGSSLFSPHPVAETRGLFVKNLSYNDGVLGDAQLRGDFDLPRKRVGIYADVAEEGRRVAIVDGGIWIGRDSLSFDINADKVNIGFLQPFMQAFASKVEGRASGNAKLYGTFSDIDMQGRLFADTITLGVAYTNVAYSGRDSVYIDPGKIIIPSFTLRDKYGNTALLEGELTHRYFHDPQFDFRVNNAHSLLVYDTNPAINPVWYGRIFGSGSGRILGIDNYVGITADMTTQANSNFTFVLSDREDAAEYTFLKFTDKKKEERLASMQVQLSEEDEILKSFRKEIHDSQQGPESVFGMDIRATITPSTTLTIVMDPVAGDKIVAHGSGAMNMTYQSDTDDLKMFGKYVLDEGVYNFSLQDLILKDFIIKNGSSISFNGDPMAGLLDIRAAYRVNANLADLDQSFALDRDLNRTNVPVDAMLLVNGVMNQPDISFDIELPTLNNEVEQKVRSVISSEDMMNLQMIYLLGLNRFYTPEYMGGTSGGEWASVASSTISSQLQNIMGQLTDKVSVLPSFKSDKGDFSDLEVDVALSSRLFNNRLLINGNFGYRDPSTSSTTFIGDFDIEYLLNRQGNWRLKAYNHFNDQNYYLKSALTTQGVGIVWRRDFNHIFGINKKRRKSLTLPSDAATPSDTILASPPGDPNTD